MAVTQPREQTLLPVGTLPGVAARSLPGPIAVQASPTAVDIGPVSRYLGLTGNSLPFKLSILMAAYNAEATIAQAIRAVLKVDYPCSIELIVVDDGSTDGTHKLLSRIDDARLITYRHEMNQGRGAALLSAARLATGSYVLLFDAGLGYSAEDIPRILAPVLADRCRVVYGTLLSGYNTVRQSHRYARGNRLLTWLANVLFDACVSDLHARLRLMPVAMLNDLSLREPGRGFDTELTALLLKLGIRPFEVPVSYSSRQHPPGEKVSWCTAMACVRILLHVRMRRRPAGLRSPRRQDDRGYDTALVPPEHPLFPRRVDAA